MTEMLLPAHGRIACRKCWSSHEGKDEFLSSDRKFKLVNDPASWGAQNPDVLVLGITKGNTQSAAWKGNHFDEVAFKEFRDRLTTILQSVGLATKVKNVSELINASETTYGWGSVIRCSLTGYDKKEDRYSGESGKVLPAFSHAQMASVVSNCFSIHLAQLPSRLRLIVLLGNADNYLRKMSKLVHKFYPRDFRADPADGSVAYEAGGKMWVHVGHPSRGNGYYKNFLEDPPTTSQGKKRELAKGAIARRILALI